MKLLTDPFLAQREEGLTRLRFTAPRTAVYQIEASTNLKDWEVIGVAERRPDGTFDFEDVNAARFSFRFYRWTQP